MEERNTGSIKRVELSRRELMKAFSVAALALFASHFYHDKASEEDQDTFNKYHEYSEWLSRLYGTDIKSLDHLRENKGIPVFAEDLVEKTSLGRASIMLTETKGSNENYFLTARQTGILRPGEPGVKISRIEADDSGWDPAVNSAFMPGWFIDYQKCYKGIISTISVRNNNPDSSLSFLGIKHAPLDFNGSCGISGVCSNEVVEERLKNQLYSLDLYTIDPKGLSVKK
jgi:hypothetical protein